MKILKGAKKKLKITRTLFLVRTFNRFGHFLLFWVFLIVAFIKIGSPEIVHIETGEAVTSPRGGLFPTDVILPRADRSQFQQALLLVFLFLKIL